MTDKSYVTLEQRICHVCCEPYDTGSILMNTRLDATFDHKTQVGMGYCPEHGQMIEQGYIALIEIDSAKSGKTLPPKHPSGAPRIAENAVHRTGRVAFLRRTVAKELFSHHEDEPPLVFVEPGVIDDLVAMQEKHRAGPPS